MFEKGRIGIFGDSISTIGQNINNLKEPMMWSQMLKNCHPEYEFLVDAVPGRKISGNYHTNKTLIRDGSQQLEPFISNSFPRKKIVIFLGTNDIFYGINEHKEGLKNVNEFEEELLKFNKLLFDILNEKYQKNMPKVSFITTIKFNFKNHAKFNNKKFNPSLPLIRDYEKIVDIFKKMKNVQIIDVSNFNLISPDGIHIPMENQKDFYELIEPLLIEET